MHAVYEGKTTVEAFPIFQANVLENYGLPQAQQDELLGRLGLVGAQLEAVRVGYELEGRQTFRSNQGELGVNWGPQGPEVRETVWSYGDEDMRSLLICGSILRGSWYTKARRPKAEEHLYFPYVPELSAKLTSAELTAKAASAVVAANDELMSIGSIPYHALGWDSTIHEMADPDEQAKIRQSLKKIRYANEMLDSDDPHAIGKYISEDDSPEIRNHLIGLALDELEAPNCRGKLFFMMNNLLHTRPKLFTKDTFNRYQRIKKRPEITGTYEEYLEQSRLSDSEATQREQLANTVNSAILARTSQEVLEQAKSVVRQHIN